MHVNEQNLNKNKTKSRHIKIVMSPYIVQFSPQTMQWYRDPPYPPPHPTPFLPPQSERHMCITPKET